MAGSVAKITAGNIVINSGLSDRPVYFVSSGGQQLVVKGEAKGSTGYDRTDRETALSVKWGSKMMKNVNDPLVNTKIMEQSEVDVFLTAARLKFKPLPTRPGDPVVQPSKQYNYVSTQDAQQFLWVKMPMVPGLSDAEFTKKVNGFTQAVPAKVKEQIIRFTEESLWAQLGKVVAVDIFNGNSDRFDISTGDWINYGNVMFMDLGNQGTKVMGLDTFDPNTRKSNLAHHGRFDELNILTQSLKQQEFALKCAKSVGVTLKRDAFVHSQNYITLPVVGVYGSTLWQASADDVETLYEPFAPAMAAGIAKGAEELKTYLQKKVVEYRQRAALARPPNRPPPPAPGGRPHVAGNAPPNRPPPPAPGGRPHIAGNPPPNRPPPPAPNRINPAINVAPIEGIPQGILDRMDSLNWLQ